MGAQMGYADRDYFRDHSTRPSGRLAGAPVVKWLLILNLGVFVMEVFFDLRTAFEAAGSFTFDQGIRGLQIWRVITFQFLHANFGHLLFNSIGIYFFGTFLEQQLRSRAFLLFYLSCGVAGALAASLLALVLGTLQWQLVGASAGLFGILVVAALIAPDMRVRLLFPPVTLTMRLLAIIALAYGVFVVLSLGRNAGGEAGHLGGALAGFLMWKTPMIRQFLKGEGRSRGGTSGKRRGFGIRITNEEKSPRRKLGPRIRDAGGKSAEVDRILDKINEHGLQSLTQQERDLLSRVGKK